MWSQIIRTENPIRRFNRSRFRASFHLTKLDILKIKRIGLMDLKETIKDIIIDRLKDPSSFNDGKQTPYSGHPIFVAQHATATCCRKCLFKWHRIPPLRVLEDNEISSIVNIIFTWILKEIKKAYYTSRHNHILK